MKSRKIIVCTAILLVITLFYSGCGKSNDESKQSAKAVVEQMLNCSVEEAESFVAVTEKLSDVSENETGVGIVSSGNEIETYIKERFGAVMTDDCCKQIANNRTFYNSIALSKQYNSDVKADNIELNKRQSEKEVFNFSAKIIAVKTGDEVASVTGTVTMVKENNTWKADAVEITEQKN